MDVSFASVIVTETHSLTFFACLPAYGRAPAPGEGQVVRGRDGRRLTLHSETQRDTHSITEDKYRALACIN